MPYIPKPTQENLELKYTFRSSLKNFLDKLA